MNSLKGRPYFSFVCTCSIEKRFAFHLHESLSMVVSTEAYLEFSQTSETETAKNC